MSGSPRTFARTYAGFLGIAFGAAACIAGLGCLVVASMDSALGFRSVLAGCGVSWVASCVGAIPVALAVTGRGTPDANAILGSTALRFLVVLFLLVPLALSGWFDRVVLMLSAVASYLVLLLLDTMLAVRAMKRASQSESS